MIKGKPMAGKPITIRLKGVLSCEEQEGGYDNDAIIIDDTYLDTCIAESLGVPKCGRRGTAIDGAIGKCELVLIVWPNVSFLSSHSVLKVHKTNSVKGKQMVENHELGVTCTRDQVCAKFKQMWVEFAQRADWEPHDKFMLSISSMAKLDVYEAEPVPLPTEAPNRYSTSAVGQSATSAAEVGPSGD